MQDDVARAFPLNKPLMTDLSFWWGRLHCNFYKSETNLLGTSGITHFWQQVLGMGETGACHWSASLHGC